MNTLRKMFLKTGIILIILQTVQSAVEKRTNRTCTGYDSSRENLVNATTAKNEKEPSGISAEGAGSSESSVVLDSRASTTQKYENSKLLFNYIVPANSKPSKNNEREEEDEDDEEEVEEGEIAATEDEEEIAAAEDGEEETAAAEEEKTAAAAAAAEEEEEEEDEEEEYRKKDVKEKNEYADVEDHDNAEYEQKDRVTAQEEKEREDEREKDGYEEEEDEEDEEEEEKEEEETRPIPGHGYKEENQDDGEEAEEEESGPTREEERGERGTTSAPIIPWRHSYPTLMREKRPRLDFTTAQPYEDAKPVSYSSVVYDPEGNSKSELSGSFYRKPLNLIPRSKLFIKELENISEDTRTIHVTTSPVAEERSIQESLQEENEEDFDAIKRGFEARPMRILNLKVPMHNFEWSLPEKLEEGEEESKNYNEKSRQKYHDKSNKEKYYEQVINTRFGEKENGLREGDDNYESEVQDLMKPQKEWERETVQKEVVSEEEGETESGESIKSKNKDRNQLYEYVVQNVPPGQGASENKVLPWKFVVTTTPKRDEAPTTAPPENKTEATIVKPYSFGTITKSDQAMTFNNPDNSDILYNQIVSDIQSMFTPSTPKPTNYEQHFLPSRGHCHKSLPDSDSANYETFVQPSHFHHGVDEKEEEEDEEEENPMPKRLPMKTYIVKKKPVKVPSGVKVTVYPVKPRPHTIYREAKPVSFRNSVYSNPVPSSNTLVRKIFYYEPKRKILHYSPTNHIFRVVKPQTTKFRRPPPDRVVIIRKL